MNKLEYALLSAFLTAILVFASSLQVAYPPTIGHIWAGVTGFIVTFISQCKGIFQANEENDNEPPQKKNKIILGVII